MTSIEEFATLCHDGRGLASIAVTRRDASIHASVVNVAVMAHPNSGETVVGFVTYGAVKLRNLRARPRCTATVLSGHRWVSVEGDAEICGPDDHPAWFASAQLPQLLRDVFVAAGGTHDDWAAYDEVMAAQRRAAVFISPTRIYGV